jgi:GNAT superfamily N-acetyltransferase
MQNFIQFEVIPAQKLTQVDQQAIQALFRRAFGEEVWCDYGYLKTAKHVIGRDAGVIVSHALWVNRSFIVNEDASLLTAYIEYVATEPARQGQGLASRLLQFTLDYIQNREVLHTELDQNNDYELAALAPEDSKFYERLGWELWQGDLSIRHGHRSIQTPDDDVMIYRLATTPKISITEKLSAEWREGELW